MRIAEVFFAASLAASPTICLESHVLNLDPPRVDTEDHGRLRTHELTVMVPVSCKGGAVLQPRDSEEGLRFLDWALPLDLKSTFGQKPYPGSKSGSKVIVYGGARYSRYSGGDSEAFRFLGGLWAESKFCREHIEEHPDESEVACAIYLAEEYARWQTDRRPWDMQRLVPSAPPSRQELGLPE